MEKKQFTFTNLRWLSPTDIQKLSEDFSVLEQYGISYDFRKGTKGTRLLIGGFDDTLSNSHDDDAISFIKKIITPCDDCEIEEYNLLVFTINYSDEKATLQLTARVITYFGTVCEIKF